ncbi:MAG: aminotransferase class V-fold PLP-dependent enzyme, partial [Polyangiaceae bacterium]
KVPFNVEEMNVDLASITAHKIYGPKGIGALYVRRSKPRVRLQAEVDGGGHEFGMRSGTLNVAGIVGFGKAVAILAEEGREESKRLEALRDRLLDKLTSNLDEVTINGSMEHRLPHNLNISFNFVEGESMLMALKDIAVSSGSACTSASLEPSYVLHSMGVTDDAAHSSLRFGVGRFNTEEEIDYVADLVIEKVNKLREMSPLWEMHKEGIDLASVQWTAH